MAIEIKEFDGSIPKSDKKDKSKNKKKDKPTKTSK